jgi:hypothetical protein
MCSPGPSPSMIDEKFPITLIMLLLRVLRWDEKVDPRSRIALSYR